MLREIIDHHGVPLALYSDRHGIFLHITHSYRLISWNRSSVSNPRTRAVALAHTIRQPGSTLPSFESGAIHLVALIENICGKLSLCFGSRHQPSLPRSITGWAWKQVKGNSCRNSILSPASISAQTISLRLCCHS